MILSDESRQTNHVARFDLAVIRKYLQVDTKNILCTKIASKLVKTYTSCHGLKTTCREYWVISIIMCIYIYMHTHIHTYIHTYIHVLRYFGNFMWMPLLESTSKYFSRQLTMAFSFPRWPVSSALTSAIFAFHDTGLQRCTGADRREHSWICNTSGVQHSRDSLLTIGDCLWFRVFVDMRLM